MSKDTSKPAKTYSYRTDPVLRRFGSPGRIILTVVSVFFLSQLIGLFVVELFSYVLGNHTGASILNSSIPAQFFYILIAEGLAAVGVLAVVKRRGLDFGHIGFGRLPNWRDVGMAAITFVGFVITLVIITSIISGLWHGYNTNQVQNVGFKNITTSVDKVLAFISLVLLPPIGEETLMRGYLYSGLRTRWHVITAGIVTSLLFGAAHLLTGVSGLLWAAGIDTFILSLFLVYLRERSGALYAGMLVHALNNVMAFIVYIHS